MTQRRVLLMAHPSRPEALEVAMGVADKLAQADIEVRLPAGELGESVLGQHPVVVVHDGDQPADPAELLLRARISLRQAIPGMTPARRALQLASAIRHLDEALGRIEGWTDGGSTR